MTSTATRDILPQLSLFNHSGERKPRDLQSR
jgi:hypothetical protein